MKADRILPTEAAAIMGASPQFVRVGLQTGQLDIGSAVKCLLYGLTIYSAIGWRHT